MNIICSICSDQLMQSDDIFYTRCGHVFHLHCLTPWLDRSKSCPQCRERVTQNKIHRLYFTFSSNDAIESQGSTLQEKVDSLKFQILLKEKDIQFYSSENVTLKKQNVGLRQEVRKVESEITKKNSAIYALKEQMNYFKEQSSECNKLKKEISDLKNKLKDLKHIQALLHAPCSDISKLVGNSKDPDTLTTYISIMKRELIERFAKCKQLRMTIKKLQEELSSGSTKSASLLEKQSKQMDYEEKLAISESKNMALQKRIDELEEILGIDECKTTSETQQSECKSITSETNLQDTLVEKNSDIKCENSTLNRVVKRKTSLHNTKNIEDNWNDPQIANDRSDTDIDFIHCSTSKNIPTAPKRSKLSEDDFNFSIKCENASTSFTSKKKRKSNVGKKVSNTEAKHINHIIDLT